MAPPETPDQPSRKSGRSANAVGDPASGFLLVGLSHRSASLALRERFYLEGDALTRLLARVRGLGLLESIVFSTCDRLEIAVVDPDLPAAEAALLAMLSEWAQVERDALEGQCYRHRGQGALRHLFSVASSLDSQVVGEPQILGQVKESHRLAQSAGASGPHLDAIMRATYATAKRVRHETPLATQPVSIAASAIEVARNLHGDLQGCTGVLAGLSEIGELLALEFKEAGLDHLTVTHEDPMRAEVVARRLISNVIPWEGLAEALAEADVLLAARGSGRFILSANEVREALRRRRQRPIFLIDCAVPQDLEPAVARLENAFVYDLEDLESVARRGQASRRSQADAAWAVLDRELDRFLRRSAERFAGPVVTSLRGHFERVRQEILAKGETDPETATRQLINRLLHDPSEVLRQAAAADRGEGEDLQRSMQRLFRIDGKADKEEGA